jgi:hypothetical protein
MHARETVAEIDKAVGVIVLMMKVVDLRMRMIALVVVIVVRVRKGMIVIVRGCAVCAAEPFRPCMFPNDRSSAATDGAHHSTSISATRNSSPAVIRT